MLLRIALVAALFSFAAQTEASEAASLCRDDALRFCADAIPDRERIAACLQRRKADLSPGCRTMFDTLNSAASRPAVKH